MKRWQASFRLNCHSLCTSNNCTKNYIIAIITSIFLFSGYSSIVLKPKSTEEVSAILKICNENNLAVCPQGGNTGLVGGSVPVFDEVILSTSLMNKIIKINDIPGTYFKFIRKVTQEKLPIGMVATGPGIVKYVLFLTPRTRFKCLLKTNL